MLGSPAVSQEPTVTAQLHSRHHPNPFTPETLCSTHVRSALDKLARTRYAANAVGDQCQRSEALTLSATSVPQPLTIATCKMPTAQGKGRTSDDEDQAQKNEHREMRDTSDLGRPEDRESDNTASSADPTFSGT